MTKILVIEDDLATRENTLDTLELEGFEVVGAKNGQIGVKMAREHLPDLILCDIQMPLLDGYGVLLMLRSDPQTATIPFIFLTGMSDRSDLRQGMDLGADDYVTKPFTSEELLTAVLARLARQATIAKEYEKKLDELRGNIIHMLPHELRTPLSGILGYSEILMSREHNLSQDKVSGMAEAIHRTGLRLFRLIENFLIYAQIELIKVDPERIEALRSLRLNKPGAFIQRVANGKAKAINRTDDLTLDIAYIATLQVDEDNLKKIIEELLDNAFKFSQPGTPVLLFTACENGRYIVRITDYGHGMTREQIVNVGAYLQFERKLYEQQGTGLGLIIAKYLAELHGGELTIESVPDKQTTVRVMLPLSEDASG